LAKAEQERKKAVEAAVGGAKSQGLKEAESLKAQAEKDRQKLRKAAANKMASAVTKVVDFLRG
jgi:vacuolar-type H+-ATPase subunit H